MSSRSVQNYSHQDPWRRGRPLPLSTLTVLCWCSWLVISAALCQTATAADATLSQALFRRGLDYMKEDRLDLACPALAESLRLEPLPGTLFTLAECEAKRGRVASAVAHYEDYLEVFSRLSVTEQSSQRKRPQIASAKRDELRPRVPHLTLLLPRQLPAGRVVVYRDDSPLGAPALGVPLPIDPGRHIIRAEVDGRAVSTQSLTLAEGQHLEVAVNLSLVAGPSQPPAVPSDKKWNRPMLWGSAILLLGAAASYGVAWSKSDAIEEAARSGRPYPQSAGNYQSWEWAAAALGVAGIGLLGATTWLAAPWRRGGDSHTAPSPAVSTFGIVPSPIGWSAHFDIAVRF